MSMWQKVLLPGLGHLPRWSNSSTIVKEKEVYFFAGCNRQGDRLIYYNDVWILSVDSYSSFSWKQLSPSGSAPTPRCAHTCTFVSSSKVGDRLLIFGGRNEEVSLNDLYYFNLATNFWVPVNPPTTVKPRCGHTAVGYQKKLVIFGGFSFPTELLNDVCIFDTETNSWSLVAVDDKKTTPPPSPRFLHSATVVGKKMFIFGGFDGRQWLSDLHVFDFGTLSWSGVGNVFGIEIPGSRCGHSAELMGNKIYIFGGEGPDGHTNKLVSLDTDKLSWTLHEVDETAAPNPRQGHSGFISLKFLYVLGGMENYDDCIYFIDLSKLPTKMIEKTRSLPKMDRGGMAAILACASANSALTSSPSLGGGAGDGGEGDIAPHRYKDLYLKEKSEKIKLQEKCNMLQEEVDWLSGKLQQMIQEREVLIAQGKLQTGPGRTDPASLLGMINEIRSRSKGEKSESSQPVTPSSGGGAGERTEAKGRSKTATSASSSASYASILSDVSTIPTTDTIRSVGKTLTSFLMKRPTKEVLVTKGILAKEAALEVPLNSQIVQSLLAEIEAKGGLESEGLFRLSGEANKVSALYNFICSNDPSKLKEAFKEAEVNTICGVFKKYFRECIPPLFPLNTVDTFVAHLEPLNLGGMKDSIALLPPLHKTILLTVMTFLKSVSDKSDLNKMTSSNLGIIFGPTLFRPTAPTTMEQIKQSNLLCAVIQKIIENFGVIFPMRERKSTLNSAQAPVQVMFK